MKSVLIATSMAITATAWAQLPPELSGLDTTNEGPSQAGARDCDKAAADQQAHFEKNLDNPQAAIFGGGTQLGCSYLERIAWKAPAAKKPPAHKGGKVAPNAAEVVRRAGEFWASSDDMHHVKVLAGGVVGTWQRMELSDTPGVASARTIDVFHVIVAALANETAGCFAVYGHLAQRNVNHPDATRPPSWSGSEYKASDFQRAHKVPCPKGAKPPKP